MVNASGLKQATILRKSHQFHQALAHINEYLKKAPEHQNALFLKGLILSDLERYSESIALFKKLINKYPATPELYNNLAIVLAFSGKNEESQKAFQKALHLRNNYREAHKNLDALKFAQTYQKYLKKTVKKDVYHKDTLLTSIQNHTKVDNNLKTCYKLLESQILTREIQTDLGKLGYYKGKIDGNFHAKIRSSIQDFQRFHHLPIKGYISWKLLAQIQDAIDEKRLQTNNQQKTNLSQMQTTRLTQKIQNGLYDLGYSPGAHNGEFHEQTRHALKQFITDHSIDDAPEITFTISGHVMKALYQAQGKWTIVPVQLDDICTHFIHLKQFIDSGYKPIHYIGYATILAHRSGHYILITNSSAHCRDMKKLVGTKNIQ
jgi:peptidoglycan hydrolase-like protein with peptidoglycan-binding domain